MTNITDTEAKRHAFLDHKGTDSVKLYDESRVHPA